jgi:hypothetical protein
MRVGDRRRMTAPTYRGGKPGPRLGDGYGNHAQLGPGKSSYSRGKSLEMVDINLRSLARDLRARAQEILARAETTYDTDAEQTMREVAASHEKLAQRVEQRKRLARDSGRGFAVIERADDAHPTQEGRLLGAFAVALLLRH